MFVFSLEKTTFEMNFSAMEKACFSAMHVCFAHFVVRSRLGTIPRREATSRSMNHFHGLFQVVDMIVTKYASFLSGILRIRSFVLMHVPK